ncbi:uncharacterized protein [Amphiura filiformis]|uniref:uncharacterized protein n=1 Tax=Amphiura filiformis TaxID=82378 RepID=UPI003B22528F
MSRRFGQSAARNAPFGTDVQPTTKTRIVGGKQVEIAVDSPPTSAGSRSSQKSLPPLTSGPHGTPPIETQPSLQGYEDEDGEEEEEREQFAAFTQKENARNLYSKTAPADKSNSHIHNRDLPGSHKVLPPISSHSPSSSHSPHNNNTIDDFSHSSSPASTQLNTPGVSFSDQLKDALEGYDPYMFQDMYKDLAQYDHKLCGYVSEAQANMVALRHQLPLNTNMLKLLFSNFAKDGHPETVNYEKMIQYLARAQLGTAEAETLLQESVNKFVNAPSSAHSGSSSGIGSSQQDLIDRFDRDREELNQQLQRQRQQQVPQQQLQQQEGHRQQQQGGHRQQQGVQQQGGGHRQQQQHGGQRQQQQQQHGGQRQQQQVSDQYAGQSGFGGGQGRHQRSPGGQRNDRRQSLERDDRQKQEAKTSVSPTRKPLRAFSDREDAKLLMMLEQQYIQGGEEPTDLVVMRNKLSAKDKSQEGTLTKKEIQDVCFAMRVPVQGSLMEKLMQRCDTGEGQYSWPAFIDFLERVKPLSTGSSKKTPEPPKSKTWPMNNREENKAPSGRAPGLPQEPGPPPWETRKPLARLHQRASPTDVEREITQYDDRADQDFPSHPSSSKTTHKPNSASERSQLESLARSHRARAMHANQEKQRQMAKAEEEAAGERWFERFMHLAKGLYSADSTNTGYLSKEEMHRILNNYNLIYQLGFQESRIDRVISTHSTPKGLVSIEHLLETLRDQRN